MANNKSEDISELTAALSKAQSMMKGAVRDSNNPFFKSKYADLSSVWHSCREALASNGIAVSQTMDVDSHSHNIVVTTLMHSSGQWIESRLYIPCEKPTPQSLGSTITYARRYALSAIVGIADADDDAEAAMNRSKKSKAPIKSKAESPNSSMNEW